MRRDPDGTLWLTPEEWLPWVYANHPEWVRDWPLRLPARSAEDQAKWEREDARHWRAGRAQGVLARTSPLNAERRDYWSGEDRRKGENG